MEFEGQLNPEEVQKMLHSLITDGFDLYKNVPAPPQTAFTLHTSICSVVFAQSNDGTNQNHQLAFFLLLNNARPPAS
jgi:hypothetical protein